MKKSFTLIELLVVICILLILVSLLLPSFRRAKSLALRAVCGSNVSQMGRALTQEAMRHRNSWTSAGNTEYLTDMPLTWEDRISDDLGFGLTEAEKNCGTPLTIGSAGISATRLQELRKTLSVLSCPADKVKRSNRDTINRSYSGNSGSLLANFRVSGGANGTMPLSTGLESERVRMTSVTNPSHTLLLGERGSLNYTFDGNSLFQVVGDGWAATSDRIDAYYSESHSNNGGAASFHDLAGYRMWVQCDGSMTYGHFSELVNRQNKDQAAP
ncbi:MAG: hypothetical protein RL095_674 [Verrucomicrobiota bacterium]|jgi:type II secretory pathway pseudopilin PulG